RVAAPTPNRLRRMTSAATVCGCLRTKRMSDMRIALESSGGYDARGGLLHPWLTDHTGSSFDDGAYPGVGILQHQLEIMETHDGRDDAQAQPGAWDGPVALGAIEPLQDGRTLIRRDAGAIVLHDELWPRRIFAYADLHRAAATRELDGVVDQV